MRDDEHIAEDVDRRKYEAELAARRAEVDAAMAEGAAAEGASGPAGPGAPAGAG
jgi:hypothetical protein